jgi:hypothetical protein
MTLVIGVRLRTASTSSHARISRGIAQSMFTVGGFLDAVLPGP